jgi:cell pole-organizing protein PopZ
LVDMSESKGQHEPSMEEILASIRRIIAEDGEQPDAAAPAPAPAAAAQPVAAAKGEEILELTEVVQEEDAAPGPPGPARAPAAPGLEPTPLAAAATDAERLVSEAAAAASLAALAQIQRIGPRNDQRMSDIPMGEGQRTIEDMVREMLRPLLKEWLDSNLPHLVERVVQEEVSRLVREVQRR